MVQLWKIAIRDLERNRRRTLLTLLAVVIGVGLLIFVSGFYQGTFDGSLEMGIQLQTSHLQVRVPSYNADQVSLQWKDLLNAPDDIAGQIRAIAGVQDATPVLWISGMLLSGDETVGVSLNGIEPQSGVLDPIRNALVAGQMLTADDHNGVLLGKSLADELDLGVGQSVSLVVNTADQATDQDTFVIRGLYDTGVQQYDETNVYLPLAKAQAFSAVGDRASAVRVMLADKNRADDFATAFQTSGVAVLTWKELNSLLMDSIEAGQSFMQLLYLIVLGMVAVVIANTLLMSVFERTHEIGILSALGMKSRQILGMFLMEAGVLGVIGVILGLLVGGAIVFYYSQAGIIIGQEVMEVKASNMITYGRVLYTSFSASQAAYLSLLSLGLILLVSLYPARVAARMEPVQALHGD